RRVSLREGELRAGEGAAHGRGERHRQRGSAAVRRRAVGRVRHAAMIVEPSIEGVRRWRHEAGGSVGLVPTMGFLHAGHMSLVERARAENDRVAVSIFVNPAQFGPREDLSTYPRDMERDLTMLREAGVDLVFTPDAAAIYPPGFDTWVEPGAIATRLEGASRPGHFRGVCTVVLKLFTIVQPERAYFGQKDAQQLRVIQRMVADLNLPVAIVPMP